MPIAAPIAPPQAALLAQLRAALRDARSPLADAALEPLGDKGLAHHHVRVVGSGLLARCPKQSQMGLDAATNLAYEAACYQRAAASGHVPRVEGVLPVSAALPHGALLVEEVIGRSARLPEDLDAIASAFAAIHSLPLPEPGARAPLQDPADPLAALRAEIDAQAAYLDAAALAPGARALVDLVRAQFVRDSERGTRAPRRLIAFDGHPGNFLVRADGRAVLVDLEKARYSLPPLDLAHATLYTSTTWDLDTRAELTLTEVQAFYEAWQRRCDIGAALRPWFVPLRAAMWLWSVTWCAKWRVLSPRKAHASADGEDWSREHSSDALIAHVHDRVDCYLARSTVERVVGELDQLADRWLPETSTRRLFMRVAALGLSGCGLGAGGGAGAVAAAPPADPPPPSGNVIPADPSNYLSKLSQLKPGDTLVLAAGNYGIDAQGNDTAGVPGLPIFNLHGTATAPIVISGPATGPRPVLTGRDTHNTIRLGNASFVVIRRLEIDGRGRAGFGVATQGSTHDITIEDNHFHGFGGDQQIVAISTTGDPTWNWVIRRNLIDGAGTGLYLGNSNGDSPFVAGLIERNVIRDSIGYNLQIKHQVAWGVVPDGMPTGQTATVIRHNVFSKSANSSTGADARPNLLVGDGPPSGPGSTNGTAIYGNFFWQNPTESLFQGEGNVAFYANLMVTSGAAVRVQTHNGSVRDVRIFHNTAISSAAPTAIAVSGGIAGTTQQVLGNAVFAASASAIAISGTTASATQNATDLATNAPSNMNAPLAAVGTLDLYPRSGSALKQVAADTGGLANFPDWNLDFNGNLHDSTVRGAYRGEGANPGWVLALDFKP